MRKSIKRDENTVRKLEANFHLQFFSIPSILAIYDNRLQSEMRPQNIFSLDCQE
jgi:hypothetical protein